MKKFVLVVLAVALAVGFTSVVSAAELSDLKYNIANNTSAGVTTNIATNYIRPGKDRIVRVLVTATDSRSDTFVGVYDCTTAAGTLATVIEGEVEAQRDEGTAELRYHGGLRIANGVTILQGPYTNVLVEYERYIP